MIILVINSGSSSIRFQLIHMEDRACVCKGLLERIGFDDGIFTYEPRGKEKARTVLRIEDHGHGINLVLEALLDERIGVLRSLGEISAVGHRVVHGGESITRAELITPRVEGIIEEHSRLAPLHNPANLMGIRAVRRVLPAVPHVAVFDTAFHSTMPEESFLFGLPYEYYCTHRIRRFGYHGISHKYVSRRAAEILGKDPAEFNCVSCHMGNGVSITAVKNGRSADTSLGFGTMCGVPMGTRAGDVDPSVVLYLIDSLGMSTDQVQRLLYCESGLKGLSGRSGDMRDVLEAAEEGSARALMALKVFAHGARKHIAALATSLAGRLDALVFAAGIGEYSCRSRQMICEGLEVLGIRLDAGKNQVQGEEAVISPEGSPVPVLVVPTREELMIALETAEVVKE